MPEITLRYGTGELTLTLPDRVEVLRGPEIPVLPDPEAAMRAALRDPIGSPPLLELARERSPESVVITMSDITRPVPNQLVIGALLEDLNAAGVADDRVTILIATGMHRPSTQDELDYMLGDEIQGRCTVIDHRADDAAMLVPVGGDPPANVNRHYVGADLKIVTGLIEPHFMAGFSGGAKGVCPGLVDLATIQRFHGHDMLADAHSTEGLLEGNPLHAETRRVADLAGHDFLVNVAITHERETAGIYAGDTYAAHRVGCEQVSAWTEAAVGAPFDLVITCAGGYPLDTNFYQTVKGMVGALPALHADSSLILLSACTEVGSPEYVDVMRRFGGDYREFLHHIARSGVAAKDQWQYQMHARVLERIGADRVFLGNDGLPRNLQAGLAVTPLPGEGDAESRAQFWIDGYLADYPDARIAVIPEGPYTMLRTPG